LTSIVNAISCGRTHPPVAGVAFAPSELESLAASVDNYVRGLGNPSHAGGPPMTWHACDGFGCSNAENCLAVFEHDNLRGEPRLP
jgi:hypothetical protein